MSFSIAQRVALASFVCVGCACAGAGQHNKPTLISSGDSVAYASRYPEQVRAAAESFNEHAAHAQQLSAEFPAHAPTPKAGDDSALLTRVLDEADADGRRASFVRARQSDRAFREFWDEERGALSARTASAVQKQQADAANCTDFDAQPAIQRSLREGFDRQLEKRLRAESEALRLLDQYKSRLSPSTWTGMQRLAAEVSLASYLVYVALEDDVAQLQELREQRDAVEAALARGLDEERSIQTSAPKGADLRASQERVKALEKARADLQTHQLRAEQILQDREAHLERARDAYERALRAARAALEVSPSAARSVRQ